MTRRRFLHALALSALVATLAGPSALDFTVQ